MYTRPKIGGLGKPQFEIESDDGSTDSLNKIKSIEKRNFEIFKIEPNEEKVN